MRSLAMFFITTVLWMPYYISAQSIDRAALQSQLDSINAEIAKNKSQLSDLQKQRTSLERDVAIYDSRIEAVQLSIKQSDILLAQLKDGIADKRTDIAQLDSQITSGKQSVAAMLRRTNEIDSTPLSVILLAGSLSEVMSELSDLDSVRKSLGSSFNIIKKQRTDLDTRKSQLEATQSKTQQLLNSQVASRKTLTSLKAEKQTLIKAAHGKESVYKTIIADKEQTAAQIKAALFSLNGGNRAASFGDMLQYAKDASIKTGVRPAIILGIMSEESNLGQNVGTGNWKKDMHPTRDVPIFEQLCKSLGLDPDLQPVSKRVVYNGKLGWGGAMGPAQFIPSTWKIQQERIGRLSGQTPPNPWDPRTATFATAVLLADNGADKQTYNAEYRAAQRYLGGSGSSTNRYATIAMQLAAKYQKQIDIVEN